VDTRHDPMTMALHWATALLVITLFGLAETWGFLRNGTPLSLWMQWLHISLGMLLAAVLATRVFWRSAFAKRLPPADTGIRQMAASTMHVTLYVLLAAQVLFGFLNCWAEQAASFFGLFSIPSPLVFSRKASGWVGLLHYYNAWFIIILSGGHASVALMHHYALRDNVLRRMLPIR
jgi:cytochrome b561